jgi:uncharacterized protein
VTPTPPVTPRLCGIRVYPIKSLNAVAVKQATIGPAGGLGFDRAWALHAVDGKWVNAKRTAAMHLIRAAYTEDFRNVTLSVAGDIRNISASTFDFPAGHEQAAEWFSDYFEQKIIVRYDPGGFPDDSIANGPTIISTASLQAVCEWFPGLELEDARLRFRASLEIDGVPAFWEDQLFGESERSVVRFRIGELNLEGSNPCARCPVPARDPLTGQNLDGFQKRFVEMREACLPEWSPRERFDHFYKLATNTRVASVEAGKILCVGDSLT